MQNPRKNVCEKGYIWNYAKCARESSKYIARIIEDSVIICDQIIKLERPEKATKTSIRKIIPTNFNKKKVVCKMKNFFFLLALLLITMTLLIAVSIYFFLKILRKPEIFITILQC